MKDELISRQAAIDAVGRYISQFDAIDANFLDGLRTTINIVKELPSAQPEPQWISVNDKLPEEGSPVLLLYINEEIGFSESCRPKFWNQLTDNTIVGWFPIPKETKING